jgi:DedD protein
VRVRLGPFATKEEAAQALSKLKGAGLPGAVLAL